LAYFSYTIPKPLWIHLTLVNIESCGQPRERFPLPNVP
jgi:hypothetical protein